MKPHDDTQKYWCSSCRVCIRITIINAGQPPRPAGSCPFCGKVLARESKT